MALITWTVLVLAAINISYFAIVCIRRSRGYDFILPVLLMVVIFFAGVGSGVFVYWLLFQG
jgi:hypothetical protein